MEEKGGDGFPLTPNLCNVDVSGVDFDLDVASSLLSLCLILILLMDIITGDILELLICFLVALKCAGRLILVLDEVFLTSPSSVTSPELGFTLNLFLKDALRSVIILVVISSVLLSVLFTALLCCRFDDGLNLILCLDLPLVSS